MPLTYEYDPTKLNLKGKDLMRFQIGDTDVIREAAISDEEITSIIAMYPNWLVAKYKIVENICNRFRYEVNIQKSMNMIDVDARIGRWEELRKELYKQISQGGIISANTTALEKDPCFEIGMHDNE